MTSCRTETETINRMQKAVRLLLQPSVSGVVVSLHVSAHSRQVEHILWCLHGSVC